MTNPIVVSITDELLAELEQLAGKATPGPWVLEADEDSCMGAVYLVSQQEEYQQPIARLTGWHDQNYLALANPATILALLQHVRELKVDAERLDFLQEQTTATGNQRFGISLQWLPTCEGEPSGYRYMHRKFATDQRKTLREAIDAARSSTR